jgi:hypothetical protein
MKPDFERILARPTASVVEAGLVMGLARNAAYTAARRGEIPVLKFGNRLRVPLPGCAKCCLRACRIVPQKNDRRRRATPVGIDWLSDSR